MTAHGETSRPDHVASLHPDLKRECYLRLASQRARRSEKGGHSVTVLPPVLSGLKKVAKSPVSWLRQPGVNPDMILWLGTHKEYDKIDVTKVIYEKER